MFRLYPVKFFQDWRIRKPKEDAESVYISEKFGVRSLHIGSDTIQSSMRIARPYDLEIGYTRAMMAFMLFMRDPRKVMMIGLGGGSLAKFVHRRLPNASTTVVELDPRVVAVARQYFRLPEEDPRLRIIIGDGATYLETVKSKSNVIIVDGYGAEAQAPALSTPAFYRSCHAALSRYGILVVNLWGGGKDYNDCVRRINVAFERKVLSLPAGKLGNIAVLAFKHAPGRPQLDNLRNAAQQLETELGLEFSRFLSDLVATNANDGKQLPF